MEQASPTAWPCARYVELPHGGRTGGAQYDMGVTLLQRLARREQNAPVSVGHVAAQSGWDRKVSAEDPSQLGIHRQFHCSLGFDYTVPSFASPDACVLHVS